MLGLITLTLIPLSHSLPRVLDTINSLTVLCYPHSPLVFIFIDYRICFQHSFSTTLCIKLKKSCLIFWSISTATIHVSITLCALVTSVCLVTFMISVCLVLFIHLLWHVTHVWLHVLQVRFQFSFLSFFPLFYCSCKVIIIIIIITQNSKTPG